MTDIARIILGEVETYGNIKASDIGIEEVKKGFIKKKKSIHLFGAVNSENAKSKVEEIARSHAGTDTEIVNDLKVDADLI